jgi:hypothetical protein
LLLIFGFSRLTIQVMGQPEAQLDLITRHEADAAAANKDFDQEMHVLHRHINTVAVNEFERELQESEPKSPYATDTPLEAIESAVEFSRSVMMESLEQAIRTKRRAIAAEHASAMATSELLSLREDDASAPPTAA